MPGISFELELLRFAGRLRSVNVFQLPGLCAINEFGQFGGWDQFPGHGVLAPGIRALFQNSGKCLSNCGPRSTNPGRMGYWPERLGLARECSLKVRASLGIDNLIWKTCSGIIDAT